MWKETYIYTYMNRDPYIHMEETYVYMPVYWGIVGLSRVVLEKYKKRHEYVKRDVCIYMKRDLYKYI